MGILSFLFLILADRSSCARHCFVVPPLSLHWLFVGLLDCRREKKKEGTGWFKRSSWNGIERAGCVFFGYYTRWRGMKVYSKILIERKGTRALVWSVSLVSAC